MKLARTLTSIFFAIVGAGVPAVVACHNDQPPATAQSVTAHVSTENSVKMGLNQNYLPEVAAVVVESGFVEWPKAAADPSAAATTGETAIGVVGTGAYAIPLGSCYYHPAAALTASNTAYASITVYKRNYTVGDATTAQVAIAQTTTAITASDAGTDAATGSWNAWEPVPIPVFPGSFLSPGDAVTIAIAKTGSGVVVPQGELVCYTTIQ